MKIVLVGEFSPPYDALTIYNLTLLERHLAAGDQVDVVDMAQLHQVEQSHFLAYLTQLFQMAYAAEQINYLTRGYDRTSIFYLFFALLIGRLCRCVVDVTIHPELFAFFGPLRSHHVGKPLLRLCFYLANKVCCGSEKVAETVIDLGGGRAKCFVQPPLIRWPDEPELPAELADFLDKKSAVVALFVAAESSFLRSEAVSLVRHWYGRSLQNPGFVIIPDAGVDVAEIEGLQLEERFVWRDGGLAEITYLLSRSSVVIRPLQSMGELFVPDYAFMLERPRRVGDYFDTGLGLTIIRKGKGLSGRFLSESIDMMPTLQSRRITDLVLPSGEPQSVLFIGAFSQFSGEETRLNQAICLELESAGLAVETIKMPQDNFDSQQTGSFFAFLGKIRRFLIRNDLILYSTQGFTRPSLLLLLGSTVLGKLCGKSVFVLFHRDAFSFFARLRSRNAGLPLLFTAFTLADGILTMDEEGYRSALQYKNAPEKFHIVQPDMSLLFDAGMTTSEEPICPIAQKQMSRSFSTALADGLARKGMLEQQGDLGSFQVRPLQCNGEFVAHEQAALIEPPKDREDALNSAGLIVIPKENPRNIDGLLGG